MPRPCTGFPMSVAPSPTRGSNNENKIEPRIAVTRPSLVMWIMNRIRTRLSKGVYSYGVAVGETGNRVSKTMSFPNKVRERGLPENRAFSAGETSRLPARDPHHAHAQY